MSVKIRLMRIGTNRRPFYRVVAVDEHKKRTGGYLELLGTYNPLTEPKEINLDQGKIDAWMKKGAQPSEGFLRIIGKAPQRPPRKPKKAPKEAPAVVTKESDESKEPEVKTETAPTKTQVEATVPEKAGEADEVLEESPVTETVETPVAEEPKAEEESEKPGT